MTKKALLHADAALVADDLVAARLEQDDGGRLRAHHALTGLHRARNNDNGFNQRFHSVAYSKRWISCNVIN